MNDLLRDPFRTFSRRSSRDDVESRAEAQPNSEEPPSLDNFFIKVQEIDGQYMLMNQLLKKLQDSNVESKALTNASEMKAIKKEMDKDVDEVRKIAHSGKLKIEELDKENLANRQNRGCGKGTGVDRTRTATTLALKKKFKDKRGEFQMLRETIHREYREIVERRVFTGQSLIINSPHCVQVSSAVDHVELGNRALLKAKNNQKSSRKWMCIAILILLVVIASILVSVLKPWHSKTGA